MTSKNVSSMIVVTPTELQAMLKLVQMVCHANQYTKIDKLNWVEYCRTAFGWDQTSSEYMVEKLRRRANRELGNAELEL